MKGSGTTLSGGEATTVLLLFNGTLPRPTPCRQKQNQGRRGNEHILPHRDKRQRARFPET